MGAGAVRNLLIPVLLTLAVLAASGEVTETRVESRTSSPVAPRVGLDTTQAGDQAVAPETEAAGPGALPASLPVRLLVPAIGVDAAVEEVGVEASGALATPQRLLDVGWYSAGPAPGSGGDAVIDGHLGLPGSPLVFAQLVRLGVGDLIVVVGADGIRRRFEVSGTASWPATAHPPGLFATTGVARLTLITCGGTYLRGTQQYTDRLLVEALFVGSG